MKKNDIIAVYAVYKEATTARNPQTGESIAVPAKYIPKAKFSSTFKREINE